MRRYHLLLGCYVPALAIVGFMVATPGMASFAIGNLVAQAVLFTALAAIPAYRTGKMSYVDMAWPWGLVCIGLQVPLHSSRFGVATAAVTVAYLAIGLRMGVPGVVYRSRSGGLKREFARYRYQRIRWAAAGWRGERVPMLLEIFLQGLANASVLALPALLVAAESGHRATALQLAATAVWAGSWLLEWLADSQKRRFAARADGTATCDAGLWRYSRHPNYFFQWMGWNALALAAVPALAQLAQTTSATDTAVLALALAGAPAFMLWTLLELTGIKPAEHFSVQRRPGYADYQRTTNSFVPGRPRTARNPTEIGPHPATSPGAAREAGA